MAHDPEGKKATPNTSVRRRRSALAAPGVVQRVDRLVTNDESVSHKSFRGHAGMTSRFVVAFRGVLLEH